jgi:putative addiction module killer protein
MSEWKIGYYNEPKFLKWFEKLAKEGKYKALYDEIQLLALAGNKLSVPHSKALGSGLFELRESYYGLRIYYTFKKDRLILLVNGGDKTTQDNDIKRARKILKQLD